jgi:Family of unknown function (DUF6174)
MKFTTLPIVILVAVTACATSSQDNLASGPMSSPGACAASDGEWISFKDLYPHEDLGEGDMRRFICNLRTHEAGKACTDNQQCKGYCAAPDGAASGQEVAGECSAYVQRVNGTLTVVDGKVTYPRSSSTMTERKAAMLQMLDAARQQWSSLGITNYEITVADENCFCLYGPYYGPNRIIVRDGKISRVVYLGERRDGFRRGDSLTHKNALKYTVNKIFEQLEQTIRLMTANTKLDVEYDPKYGFPTLIDFDRPDWEDEQSRLIVTDFQAS